MGTVETSPRTIQIPANDLMPAAKYNWLRQLAPPMMVAFAIRMIVVYFYYRQLPDANLRYEQFGWEVGWVARSLALGHGFSSPFWVASGPTAMVPPLYTFLLAGIFRLFGIYTLTSGFIILTLNSLFSTLTCAAVYWSARHSLGGRAAKIAAWAWAVYPFAIYFSGDRVWEYALTSLLFTTCFCLAQRLHSAERWPAWAGYGALCGVTGLSNPATLSVFPFLLLLAMWKARRARWSKAEWGWLRNGILAVAAALAVLAPWTIRNHRVLHVLCPVRDDYWINIYAGNYKNPSFSDRPSHPAAHPPDNPEEMRPFLALGEVNYLKLKRAMATDWIRKHPLDFARAVRHRAVYYWTGYWSLKPEYLAIEPTEIPMMFYVSCVTILMLSGIWRLWRWNREALMPYLVLVVVFPIAYCLSLVLIDYRQPIEPAIVVLAVAGAVPLRRAKEENWLGAERAA
jgi:4-amino-4-deoxy-L-arabinose transferase-like glycosyltransferase